MNIDEAIMTNEEQQVWQVLATCRGREMAILGPEIEQITGIRYKQIQRLISQLICHHGKLIGSSVFGYYIPCTQKEAEASARYLRDRAIVALYRAAALQRTSLDEVYGQARLEFEKAS